MRRLLAPVLALLLAASACTAAPADGGESGLADRIAEQVLGYGDSVIGLAVKDDGFALLVELAGHPGISFFRPDGDYRGPVLDLGVLGVPATPAQFDVAGLQAAVRQHGPECDSGWLVALGPDAPPLIATGCAGEDLSIGQTRFSPSAEGWLSPEGVTFLQAFVAALGDPRLTRFTVTEEGPVLGFVPDGAAGRRCNAVRVEFVGGLPTGYCEAGVGTPDVLPRLSAAAPDLGSRLAAAAKGEDARIELVWTDPSDPRPLLQAGTPTANASFALTPEDEQAARARNDLPALTATTWPTVESYPGGGVSLAEQTYYQGGEGDLLIAVVEPFGGSQSVALDAEYMSTVEGARCTTQRPSTEVVCRVELPQGGYLAVTARVGRAEISDAAVAAATLATELGRRLSG
ncbi:hypothetical protein [Tessaracoccus aquimaris]|uniref:hypothetical protein n=1 Tax=Tessaracoccus aquimaris TaxID=1332264 RepID=UPI0011AB689E|nr:hypothetical protein [Tessaracoccus aquimaris]